MTQSCPELRDQTYIFRRVYSVIVKNFEIYKEEVRTIVPHYWVFEAT